MWGSCDLLMKKCLHTVKSHTGTTGNHRSDSINSRQIDNRKAMIITVKTTCLAVEPERPQRRQRDIERHSKNVTPPSAKKEVS